MKLNTITDDKSSNPNRKRVGRGIGSGTGKTCGKGHKGQKSRSGVSINGFEGGQMPIYRRLPKRGFTNIFRTEYQTINIGELQKFVDAKRIDGSKVVGKKTLLDAGILKKANLPFKVLGKGSVKASLKLEADAASASAVKAVEKAGGKITLVKKAEAPKEVKTSEKKDKKTSKDVKASEEPKTS